VKSKFRRQLCLRLWIWWANMKRRVVWWILGGGLWKTKKEWLKLSIVSTGYNATVKKIVFMVPIVRFINLTLIAKQRRKRAMTIQIKIEHLEPTNPNTFFITDDYTGEKKEVKPGESITETVWKGKKITIEEWTHDPPALDNRPTPRPGLRLRLGAADNRTARERGPNCQPDNPAE
jgi:hypothetical protein